MGFAPGMTTNAEASVEALAGSGDVAGLIEAAGHADPRIRKAAASWLTELGPGEAAPAAVAALRHPSDRVRCAAIRALCHWGEAIPLAEAVYWLPPEGGSRALALAAIAQLEDPKSVPFLTRSLVCGTAQDGLWEDEVELVLSLCRSRRKATALRRIIAVLSEALEDEHEEVAGRAEEFLAWLGEDAVPAVTELARSSTASDRAVWALGQIGGASVLEPLIEAIDHPNTRTREEACVALGELRDPVAVDALIRATRDREHGVRVRAAAALERIGTVAFVLGASALLGPQIETAKPRPSLARAVDESKSTRASTAKARRSSLGA